MIDLARTKVEIFAALHARLNRSVASIASTTRSREEKAKEVNALVKLVRDDLTQRVSSFSGSDRPDYALTLNYCCSVASLEYRHKVWPYEYMAFSRRVGELWEAFCSAAWDYPSRTNVARIHAPSFESVRDALLTRIRSNVGTHGKRNEILEDVELLFEVIGDINMKEDEVFCVNGTPHVVDFKSGFGSNEKGNMLRLQTVGKAYRIWNHDTKLLLLVRQEENNNYLRVLRNSGLWEVFTGEASYEKISHFTGADILAVRSSVVAWETDLSPELYKFLVAESLMSYLDW